MAAKSAARAIQTKVHMSSGPRPFDLVLYSALQPIIAAMLRYKIPEHVTADESSNESAEGHADADSRKLNTANSP